jgi:hypothetical protein
VMEYIEGVSIDAYAAPIARARAACSVPPRSARASRTRMGA